MNLTMRRNDMYDVVQITDVKEISFSTKVVKTIQGEYAYSIWEVKITDFRNKDFEYYAFSSDKSLAEFKQEVCEEIEEDFNRSVALEVALVLGGQR